MTECTQIEINTVRKKFYYTVGDLMVITGYGRTKASQLMGRILEVSDSLGYGRGRCLREDFEAYLRYNRNKTKEKENL